jgi:NADP-dependent 3-hydroxy acid dehydrogenase YdfG
MRSQKKPGVIINISSVAGIYPMSYEPVYSGTKGSFLTQDRYTIHMLSVLAAEQLQRELILNLSNTIDS